MAQFGQWLSDRQERMMRDWMAQQKEAQDSLLRGLGQALATGKPGGEQPTNPRPPPPQLTKLTEEDDVETYLEVFERTAEMAQWPKAQWSYAIGPYLTGGALAAMRALTREQAADYDALKAAILDRYEITEETWRQKFRSRKWKPGERPRLLASELESLAARWLDPKTPGERGLMNKVIAEQILQTVPREVRIWLQRSRPANLAELTALLENYVAAEPIPKTPEPRKEPNPNPRSLTPGRPPEVGAREGRARPGPRPPNPRWTPRPPVRPRFPPDNRPPVPSTGERPTPPRPTGPSPLTPPKGPCFTCGQMGHFQRECPLMECDAGWDMAWPLEGSSARWPPSSAKYRWVRTG